MEQALVSVVVPTYNNGKSLAVCLDSIRVQTYPNVELIVVDNDSADNTRGIAEKHGARFFTAGPDQSRGRVFGAPFQRNFGFCKSRGEYVYYVDADMILPEGLIEECVDVMKKNLECKALIIAEESFGMGFWAKCKWLERRTYWGDDTVEAPRFFDKATLEQMGYLDDTVGADDWDLALRMRRKSHEILRTKNYIRHDEGNLKLSKLIRKRFLYGKDVFKFKEKHGTRVFYTYFTPFRRSYLKNTLFLLSHPILLAGMIFMRACEYSGGAAGIMYGKFIKKTR